MYQRYLRPLGVAFVETIMIPARWSWSVLSTIGPRVTAFTTRTVSPRIVRLQWGATAIVRVPTWQERVVMKREPVMESAYGYAVRVDRDVVIEVPDVNTLVLLSDYLTLATDLPIAVGESIQVIKERSDWLTARLGL